MRFFDRRFCRRAAPWGGRLAVLVAILVALGAGPFHRAHATEPPARDTATAPAAAPAR